jgi:hypothetical protein
MYQQGGHFSDARNRFQLLTDPGIATRIYLFTN